MVGEDDIGSNTANGGDGGEGFVVSVVNSAVALVVLLATRFMVVVQCLKVVYSKSSSTTTGTGSC